MTHWVVLAATVGWLAAPALAARAMSALTVADLAAPPTDSLATAAAAADSLQARHRDSAVEGAGTLSPPTPVQRTPGAHWSGQLEFGVTAQSGNTDKLDTTVKGRIARVGSRSTLALTGTLTYAEALGAKNAQENSGALNYDHYRWARWSLFGFSTLLNNPFQDLRFRLSVAAGVRYLAVSGSRGYLALSLAGIRETEEFLDRTDRHRSRFSWRNKGEWRLTERLIATNVTFFVQTFSDPFDDYRVDSITNLTIPAGGVVAFRHSFRYAYDTTPRPGVETTDRKFSSSVVLTLR